LYCESFAITNWIDPPAWRRSDIFEKLKMLVREDTNHGGSEDTDHGGMKTGTMAV
jgi:hypothetical protein